MHLPGSSHLLVAGTGLGWPVGGRVALTTSSYNWQQAEERSILAVTEAPSAAALAAAGLDGAPVHDSVALTPAAGGGGGGAAAAGNATSPPRLNVTLLQLDRPLAHAHAAAMPDVGGARLDMRPEVALLTASISVAAVDGDAQAAEEGGERFGVRVLAAGPSLLQLDNVAVTHCGQAGLGRPCVHFDRLQPLAVNSTAAALAAAAAAAGRVPAAADAADAARLQPAAAGPAAGRNPSFQNASVITRVFDLAVWLAAADNPYLGTSQHLTAAPPPGGSYAGALVSGSVLAGSSDVDTLRADVAGAVVAGNLGWGTVKDMSSKSKFDNLLPATFRCSARITRAAACNASQPRRCCVGSRHARERLHAGMQRACEQRATRPASLARLTAARRCNASAAG